MLAGIDGNQPRRNARQQTVGWADSGPEMLIGANSQVRSTTNYGRRRQHGDGFNGGKEGLCCLYSAALYSLIETTKANDLEPYQYLRHVFKELPKAQSVSEIENLLPFNVDRKELNQVVAC